MDEITDQAIILELRPHGENHAVVHFLSAAHGRMAGFLFGGQGRRQQPNVQPGNRVNFTLTHKIMNQLGTLQLELIHNPSVAVLHDPARLAALQFLCPLLARGLPEHHPYPQLFHAALEFLQNISASNWAANYVRLEKIVLAELGYGLDFSRCALTDERDVSRLAYVSPKTGRAATAEAAQGYERNLFPLPAFLVRDAAILMDDLCAGLAITGYFLEKFLIEHRQQHIWPPRARLLAQFQQTSTVA